MRLQKEQFLVAITTISAKYGALGNSWQDKIKEIDEIGLKKAAIFLTCLNKKQRQEMYGLLEKTSLKKIPFAHIKSDMDQSELDYLASRFKTRVFNTHSERQFPFEHNLEQYKKQIFIENTLPWDKQEIKKFAGLCLDFSHLHDDELLHKENYLHNLEVLKEFTVGCNHISATSKSLLTATEDGRTNIQHYDKHLFSDLSEFDYLQNYPPELFSNFCAMELENSLAEQLTAIDYIVKLLNHEP
ncbi:MAG: hypothetical protein PHE77_01370 [Candidatus Pacebacteria bacterium]|nr:hypothetical protein [Candidatus Paceibacterota bacterium]